MSAAVTLPKPPAEVPVQRALSDLAPKFHERVDELLARMARDGEPAYVFEGLRTQERQVYLYGFGREYDDGRGRVTNSRDADESWHGFGLAVDIIHATLQWGAPAEFWTKLGGHCRDLGLLWGADWDGDGLTRDERFVDRPHVQWGKPMRRSPSPRATRLRNMGGLEAVWREVGAAT